MGCGTLSLIFIITVAIFGGISADSGVNNETFPECNENVVQSVGNCTSEFCNRSECSSRS